MVGLLDMENIRLREWGIENLGGVETLCKNTLSYAENKAFFLKAIANPNITVLLTKESLFLELKFYFWVIHNLYGENLRGTLYRVQNYRGINVKIHPSAYIEDRVHLGDNVEIGAQAYIASDCTIGDNSYVGNGVVIGAQGLELAYNGYDKVIIKRFGSVKLHNNVHIFDNSVVSKSVWGITELQESASIAVLCNIAANCVIGKAVRMSGNCLVGGSAKLGENVILGPSVTIKDGITIGANSRIRIGSVVVQSCPENSDISGNFAFDHLKNTRHFARLRNG